MFLFAVIAKCECVHVPIIAVTQFEIISILPREHRVTGMQFF